MDCRHYCTDNKVYHNEVFIYYKINYFIYVSFVNTIVTMCFFYFYLLLLYIYMSIITDNYNNSQGLGVCMCDQISIVNII